jgi:hypothetical protein
MNNGGASTTPTKILRENVILRKSSIRQNHMKAGQCHDENNHETSFISNLSIYQHLNHLQLVPVNHPLT